MKAIELLAKLGVDPEADMDDLSTEEKAEMIKKLASYYDMQAHLNIGAPDDEPAPEPDEK